MKFILTFFLLVVFFSSAELFLLLKVAANFGFFPAFSLCVLTGIIGGALVRSQGLTTLLEIRKSIEKGKIPAEEIVGGLMLVIIGALLMVPGFITDILGFLMLIAPLRRIVSRKFLQVVGQNIKVNVSNMGDDAIEVEARPHEPAD